MHSLAQTSTIIGTQSSVYIELTCRNLGISPLCKRFEPPTGRDGKRACFTAICTLLSPKLGGKGNRLFTLSDGVSLPD